MHAIHNVRGGRSRPGWARRGLLMIFAAFLLALVPLTVAAQGTETTPTDIQIRIDGPVSVPVGSSSQNVVVISDNATIDGTVTDQLVVIDGDAQINGTVEGTVVLVNGHVNLGPGARVGKDVLLYRSTISQDASASVGGTVSQEWDLSFSRSAYIWLWVSMTIMVLAAGLVFALAGGRQLESSARIIGRHPGESIASMLVFWLLLPILAVLAMVTVVGIPLGLSILLFLMPVLWFVGYLIAGTSLGELLLRLLRQQAEAPDHPYLAVILGVLLLQLLGLVPYVGGVVVFLAGSLGAGALIYRTWHQARGAAPFAPAPTPPAPVPPTQAAPTA